MNQSTQWNELELKWDIWNITMADFKAWMQLAYPVYQNDSFYHHVEGRDDYYRNEGNVVRHRYGAIGAGELTVKVRTSHTSIVDRMEVDLHLDGDEPQAVKNFLKLIGYKLDVSLFKTADIWNLPAENVIGAPRVIIASYDIFRLTEGGQSALSEPRRFLEVEVEKSPSITVGEAHQILHQWDSNLRSKWTLGEPLKESMYEIYTPNRYRVHEAP